MIPFDFNSWKTYLFVGIIVYIVYRVWRMFNPPSSSYLTEVDEIISNDKYKVKGRFEE